VAVSGEGGRHMSDLIIIEITIISRKDGTEKLERFPMDKGLYKAYMTLSEEERKKYLDKEYRSFKREQKIQRKQVSLERMVEKGNELVNGFVDPSLQPDKSVQKEEDLKRLEAGIRTLTPLQLKTVRAVYYEDKTQREFAEEIGITEGAVSRILARALAKLRTKFKDEI
jgi:RNA polymerase sigma factor (sigma-70 family)